MPFLPLEGVDLYYETTGRGPLLLLISGADGRGSVWNDFAQELSTEYTVVTLDRRGYSQSLIKGAQDYTHRLDIDADDIAHLITRLNPGGGATVIGNSSGAIVGINLLLRHPDQVHKLICHEPPAFGALEAAHRELGIQMVTHIYNTYRQAGPIRAMEVFTGGLSVGQEGQLMRSLLHPGHSYEIRANSLLWFEFELRQYPSSDVDMKGLLALRDKFVPAAGIASGDEAGVGLIAAIAHALGRDILRLPGGHLGFITDPKSWAKAILEAI